MDTVTWFINQETQKYESHCMSARQVVLRAKTMWEVKRAADVPVPSMLRGMRLNHVGGGRQLEQAAERKMSELLDMQLKQAAALTDIDERRSFLGTLRHREWQALRGDFSSLYRKADMEAQRLVAKL